MTHMVKDDDGFWRITRTRNHKAVEEGQRNLERVREYFATHLCATQRECAAELDLSVMAVNRYVAKIRAEWR